MLAKIYLHFKKTIRGINFSPKVNRRLHTRDTHIKLLYFNALNACKYTH